MYLMVISLINEGKFPFQNIDMNALETEMENLLFKHLPLVYCSETISTLEQIYETGESTTSILSNTGFIRGKTLRKVLNQLNLDSYFDFQLYSDEAGMSKPNPDFFKLMLNQVAVIKKIEKLCFDQIIHIGDNEKADVKGACAVGIQSLLINSNDQSISSLIN
jgi:putative hydrolase of the HAD superfamily